MIEFSEIRKALGDKYKEGAAYRLIEVGPRAETLSAMRGGYIYQAVVKDPQVDDSKVFAIFLKEDTKCQQPQKSIPKTPSTSKSKTTPTMESSLSLVPSEKETYIPASYRYSEDSPDSNTSKPPSSSSGTGKKKDGSQSETHTSTESSDQTESSSAASWSKEPPSEAPIISQTSESSSSTPISVESQD